MSTIPPDDAEALRRLFQADTSGLGDGSDPGEIWDAASGDGSPEALRDALAQVRGSATLRQEWRLAQAFQEELGEAEDVVVEMPRRRPRRFAVAAVLLMAAAALLMMNTPQETRWRDSDQAVQITSTLQGDPLSRSRPLLSWTDLGSQATYTVTVTDDQLQTVAFAPGLTTPQWHIPTDALADLPAGTVLLWRVAATLEDGTRSASATQRITLESPQ